MRFCCGDWQARGARSNISVVENVTFWRPVSRQLNFPSRKVIWFPPWGYSLVYNKPSGAFCPGKAIGWLHPWRPVYQRWKHCHNTQAVSLIFSLQEALWQLDLSSTVVWFSDKLLNFCSLFDTRRSGSDEWHSQNQFPKRPSSGASSIKIDHSNKINQGFFGEQRLVIVTEEGGLVLHTDGSNLRLSGILYVQQKGNGRKTEEQRTLDVNY